MINSDDLSGINKYLNLYLKILFKPKRVSMELRESISEVYSHFESSDASNILLVHLKKPGHRVIGKTSISIRPKVTQLNANCCEPFTVLYMLRLNPQGTRQEFFFSVGLSELSRRPHRSFPSFTDRSCPATPKLQLHLCPSSPIKERPLAN